ncbi:MAG: KOW motif-containing protein [Candidatus Micrarchaeota archaeon]|nr:KOW motif-containing protein [Candidatus Micrarchaeota archaeon]
MKGIEPGRVCIKTRGRDAGSKCVIIEVIDHNFVRVISAGRKSARRANIAHLEPIDRIVDVSNESEVKSAIS